VSVVHNSTLGYLEKQVNTLVFSNYNAGITFFCLRGMVQLDESITFNAKEKGEELL